MPLASNMTSTSASRPYISKGWVSMREWARRASAGFSDGSLQHRKEERRESGAGGGGSAVSQRGVSIRCAGQPRAAAKPLPTLGQRTVHPAPGWPILNTTPAHLHPKPAPAVQTCSAPRGAPPAARWPALPPAPPARRDHPAPARGEGSQTQGGRPPSRAAVGGLQC